MMGGSKPWRNDQNLPPTGSVLGNQQSHQNKAKSQALSRQSLAKAAPIHAETVPRQAAAMALTAMLSALAKAATMLSEMVYILSEVVLPLEATVQLLLITVPTVVAMVHPTVLAITTSRSFLLIPTEAVALYLGFMLDLFNAETLRMFQNKNFLTSVKLFMMLPCVHHGCIAEMLLKYRKIKPFLAIASIIRNSIHCVTVPNYNHDEKLDSYDQYKEFLDAYDSAADKTGA
ncbi:hypothetical protein BDR26DRAFT_1012348 [Obelidium mucronatum]|nr:hypothetical protein BDR26DRAFT_1012348 [Obelidium mucronatum]